MREGTKAYKEAFLMKASIKKHVYQLPKLYICTKQAEQEPILISAFGC